MSHSNRLFFFTFFSESWISQQLEGHIPLGHRCKQKKKKKSINPLMSTSACLSIPVSAPSIMSGVHHWLTGEPQD